MVLPLKLEKRATECGSKLEHFRLYLHGCETVFVSSANPQAMTLYGGRMTAARLQQVGDVTAEAIERIHK